MPFFASFRSTILFLQRIAVISWESSVRKIHPRPGTVLLVCFFWLLSTLSTVSASPETQKTQADILNLPSEYGKVIYRMNADSSKQLYIIGINHRAPDSGRNNGTTVQTQMEVFRIGEWLNQNMRLNLVLPEGFFSERGSIIGLEPSAFQPLDFSNHIQLDNLQLQKRLAADTCVNAEMLLMECRRFRAAQVEDKGMYKAVRESLCRLNETSRQPSGNIEELLYLQEVRTARILQNIPGAIETEYRLGAIKTRSAMFTIGLNHIKDIFRYIQDNCIHIASPTGSDAQPDFVCSSLNLLDTGYGVTIIIPRTLANDRKLLQMTRIDRILLANNKSAKRVR